MHSYVYTGVDYMFSRCGRSFRCLSLSHMCACKCTYVYICVCVIMSVCDILYPYKLLCCKSYSCDCLWSSFAMHGLINTVINSHIPRFIDINHPLDWRENMTLESLDPITKSLLKKAPRNLWCLRQLTLSNGSVSKPCTPVVHIKIAGLKWVFIPLKMVFS